MEKLNKIIFGKRIQFNTDDYIIESILLDRFKLYPNFESDEEVIVNINQDKPKKYEIVSMNPKLHTSFEKGFEAIIGNSKISWNFGEKLEINAYIDAPKKSIITFAKKVISREFNASSKKIIDQIIYEQVLVPTMYYFENYALIHSAGFKYKGKTFLLGGTGGTGKTSASLEIAKYDDTAFINDDMSVIDSNGDIYPNLAYPKIYAYNTVGDKELETSILIDKSLGNKLHWKIMKKINIARVRRKIAPNHLFKSVTTDKLPLDYYIILFKDDVTKMHIQEISKEAAIDSTIAVMQSEYSGIFNNHVFWHEFNSIMKNKYSSISMKKVTDNWRNVLNSAFNNKKLLKLSIPLDISHTEYKRQLGRILEELTNSEGE